MTSAFAAQRAGWGESYLSIEPLNISLCTFVPCCNHSPRTELVEKAESIKTSLQVPEFKWVKQKAQDQRLSALVSWCLRWTAKPWLRANLWLRSSHTTWCLQLSRSWQSGACIATHPLVAPIVAALWCCEVRFFFSMFSVSRRSMEGQWKGEWEQLAWIRDQTCWGMWCGWCGDS